MDLFAGAGGLSLGFEQTGKFKVKVAYELNEAMQATYRYNHKDVNLRGDVCKADYKEIKETFNKIDVIIGGPPCQGFSNANRQKNHAISQNNMLVKQYLRAILEIRPKAFVMENVSMLKSAVHRFYLDEADEERIHRYGIPVKKTHLNLLDEEYLFDGCEGLVKDQEMVEVLSWKEDAYDQLSLLYRLSKNRDNLTKMEKALSKHKKALLDISRRLNELSFTHPYFAEINIDVAQSLASYYRGEGVANNIKLALKPAIALQKMLRTAKEIFDNKLVVDRYVKKDGLWAEIRSYTVYDYLSMILSAEGYILADDVLCAADFGAPQKRNRFVLMGVQRKYSSVVALPQGTFNPDNYRTVGEAIKDLEDIQPVIKLSDDEDGQIRPDKTYTGELYELLADSKIVKNHIITDSRDTAKNRFAQIPPGGNFHTLPEAMKVDTYADVSRTQNTIYLRLDYNQPSGTVVNVRKSMWIHPTQNRAISVREAARLQTFPDSFVFCGNKDKQYQQVGNAVPPLLAKAIATQLAKILDGELKESDVMKTTLF